MYVDYFLICKKANCGDCKTFKIPISAYDLEGMCALCIEKKHTYSSVCQSYRLAQFLDLDKVITKQPLEYLKNQK